MRELHRSHEIGDASVRLVLRSGQPNGVLVIQPDLWRDLLCRAVLAAYAGDSMRSVAWLFLAATVVMILPLLAVTVRRVHDTNVTGWAALAQFIPYIGLLVMFVHMSIPGTVGPNRYGDDPLASRRGDRALGQY